MMKLFLAFLILPLSSWAQTAIPSPTVVDDSRAPMSGVPRLVRDNPVPQVFFENGNPPSLYIDTRSTDTYNRIMSMMNGSLRSHLSVKMLVNLHTKTIVDVIGDAPKVNPSVYDDDILKSPEKPPAEKPVPTTPPATGTKSN